MITFDLSLYSSQAIKQAISDYQNIAQIRSHQTDTGVECYLEKAKYDLKLTEMEFSNYVLCLTVSMSEGNNGLC